MYMYMVKTKTNRVIKEQRYLSLTKKNRKPIVCRDSYKPFEKEFGKTLPKSLKKSQHLTKDFLRELNQQMNQSKIKPQNDYYNYVNYRWLENKEPDSVILDERQKYITQVDSFRIVQDKVYYQLFDIMKEYTFKNHNPISKCLKNFYTAAMNLNPIENSKKLIREYIEKLDEMRQDKNNVWKWLAYVNQNEIYNHGAPFVFSVFSDEKDSKTNRCYLNPHAFGLVDINIYYDDGKEVEYKANYRRKFNGYIKKLFNIAVPGEKLDHTIPFKIEQDLFNLFGCTSLKESTDGSNKVYADDALIKYGFDWKAFTKELGFQHTPSFFLTSNLNYLKCGSELLVENWNSERWRAYWIYIYVREIARMTQKWLKQLYTFYGGFERGIENIPSPEVRTAIYSSLPFNTFLSNQYIDKYQDESQLDFFRNMAEDLREVFIRIIKRNTWLDPKTKKYALLKLRKIDIIIGSPKKLEPDPLLDYKPNEFIQNMFKILDWRFKRFIRLEGKKVIDIPQVDWTQFPQKYVGTQPYIVNAMYTPSKNNIYIPLGYIQPPFIDLDNRGIEYNLATLGCTLTHELSHSLDDWGSKYDHEGNLNDWWTDSDKKKFKQIQENIITQYNEWAKRDGIIFDASIGIGENLADISGLAICDEYLRDFQKKNKDIAQIRGISYEAFYIYFAYQQRQKVTKKALSAQLKTNPHPLSKYRTNVPLSRSLMFTSIYDVKPGEKMYWPNRNPIW